MAKIDVTQVVIALTGEPVRRGRAVCQRCRRAVMICPDCDSEGVGELEELTLREVCRHALANTLPGDDKLKGDDKFKHFHLALKILDNDEVEMKSEVVTMLKERIARAWSTIVMGRAWEMLDPEGE